MTFRPMVVFGTRPEVIKLAPVIHELKRRGVEPWCVFTGQHPDLVPPLFDWFGIGDNSASRLLRPELNISAKIPPLYSHVHHQIEQSNPTCVIVQGDTLTTTAAAMAAFYTKTPLVHVEAGLRTYDMTQPWPEEFNRRVVTLAADLHFCSTIEAWQNVARDLSFDNDRRECPGNVHIVGQTGIDAAMWTSKRTKLTDGPRVDVLVTMHRRENHGMPSHGVHEACSRLTNRGFSVLWIDHPNPASRVGGPLPLLSHVGPLSYPEMVDTMSHTRLILTDSGGLVEEAPSFGVPVLILRDKTERPEAVEAGCARIVGTDPERIVAEATKLLTDPAAYKAMQVEKNPFGDGHAAERIVDVLMERYR